MRTCGELKCGKLEIRMPKLFTDGAFRLHIIMLTAAFKHA